MDLTVYELDLISLPAVQEHKYVNLLKYSTEVNYKYLRIVPEFSQPYTFTAFQILQNMTHYCCFLIELLPKNYWKLFPFEQLQQ